MPPHRETLPAARSAAEVNEEIRALWSRAGRILSPDERQEYEVLVTEWAEAMQREIVEAA